MLKKLGSRTLPSLKYALAGVCLLTLIATGGDSMRLNSVQYVAAPYSYDIISWHLANFLSKWTHKVARSLPGIGISEEDRLARLGEYFALAVEAGGLKSDIDRIAADSSGTSDLADVEAELEQVRARKRQLRSDVEEAIESGISEVVRAAGLGVIGEFVFPPVDIRLTEPPKVLVTSPRDRIERSLEVLVGPHVDVGDREEMEASLLESDDLAALVIDIGGVATYPASLYDGGNLRGTLRTATHEWLHHYFFFRPLGQNMFKSSEMQVVNETAADLAGRELGDMAYRFLGGTIGKSKDVAPVRSSPAPEPPPEPADRFDFDSEMRETRQRTDQLLADGDIAEAEAYMERQRQVFVANGHPIRKINQAYFAFNGTYAESAGSASPIGGQLRRFRESVADIGEFVERIRGVSDYEEFLSMLDEDAIEAGGAYNESDDPLRGVIFNESPKPSGDNETVQN
ncbi:MAG: hypothetical protein QGI88_14660 [SAR202 cluster bacterium]|jgi:hypothetical protein|nr:hypothetical protein [SAR202 cluster bacterium]